ncbi:MAG: ComEC family competence protein [Bacteroidales bacterium]|nr:ComEC family competence protein [Bacteroidales bacterium]
MTVCALTLFYIHASGKSDRNPLFGIIIFLFLITAGFALSGYERDSFSVLPGERKTYAGEVADFPEIKEKSVLLKVKLRASLSDSVQLTGGILLYHRDLASADRLSPGDIIFFSCQPREIKNNGNPREFDYRRYMERHGFRYMAFTEWNDLYHTIRPGRPGLVNRARITRNRIVKLFGEKGLKGEGLAIASAITLGEKSYLDSEQKDNFSKAGVMHIMAVSGLHAGILSMFIFWLLFFLKGKMNFLRVAITIAVLWVFAFITGLAPSIVRASLMFSFLHAGRLLKRNPDPLNSMLASAFLILLFNPLILPDASFLLSFAAVAFIILFYRNIYGLVVTRYLFTDKIWGLASVSLAAQAGTLPLTVMFFNRFPLLFLFSNLVIIPVASLAVISGFLTVILSFSGLLSDMAAYLLDKTSSLAGSLSAMTASLPFSSAEGLGMSTTGCILLMVLTAVVLDTLRKGSSNGRYIIILLFLLSVNSFCRNLSLKSDNELIVYNTPGNFCAGVRCGRSLELFCYSDTLPAAVGRHCARDRLRLEIRKLDKNIPWMINAGPLRIIVTGKMTPDLLSYKPDIAIVTGSKVFHSGNTENGSRFVYTSAMPGTGSGRLFKEDKDSGPWFVREKGCFRLKL